MSFTRRIHQALQSRRKGRRSGFRRMGLESLESRRVLATVTFDADPSILEGNDGTRALVFTVRRDANDGPETVDFTVAGNSATLGVDFQDVSGTLDFNQGNDLVDTISVPIIGETTLELDETFFVNLSNPMAGLVIGDPQATGTITNDDMATVSASNVTLVEGDAGNTAFEFTVALSGNVDSAFTVDIATGNFNATAGVDYDNNFATLNFDGNDGGQQTFTVQVTGDTLAEANETFSATLFNPQAGGRAIVLSSGLGTITNDDAVLTVSDVTLNEGDAGDTAFEFTTTLAGDVANPFTVDIATVEIPGGATGGVDFTANSATLNFAGNNGEQQMFTVQVSGENLVEAFESFSVELSSVQANGSTFTLNNATGTIMNDDSAVVSVSGQSVNEATGMVDFTVALSNPVDATVTVDFSTMNGTATAGLDFTGITNQQVTFAPMDVAETVTVTVADDMVVERNETLLATLANLAASERNVTLSTDSPSSTILNDDMATLTVSNVTLAEGDAGNTAFDFTVTLAGDVDTAFTVDIAAVEIPGGATLGTDFSNASATLAFNGTDGQQQSFTVQVLGEDLVELNEMFAVNLSNLQANDRQISLINGTGTITNDDATTLSIVAAQTSIAEGDSGTTSVTYTVTSSHAVPGGFTVALNAAGPESNDFSLSTNMLQFVGDVAGEQQTFTLDVSGDMLVEFDETVTVTLGAITGTATGIDASTVTTGATASTTISNDDLATISINSVTLNEGDGPGNTAFDFTVSIDKMASHDITVVANTAATGATGGGTDFNDLVNTTVTIPVGSNSATVTVNVVGENLVELDETFQVNLTDARFNGETDASRTVTSGTPGTGMISNDDAAVLSIADVSLAEGDSGQTAFQFTLTLTNPVDTNVTINADTSSGTAISGQDFTALVAAPFTVTSPNTTGTVTVQVSGETQFEANEIFNVAIGNLAAGGRNVTLGDTQAVGTIQNDDTRIAGFAYLDSNGNGQRDDGETGLAGTLITVTRTDVAGATPTRQILTDLNGRYVFMNQPAGTYTVTQRQPLAMVDGQETIGTGASGAGNATTNDTFQQVVLAAGDDGQDYNFGELRTVTPVSMRWYLSSSAALPLLFRERIANVEELAGNTELAARIRAGESLETAITLASPPAGEGEEFAVSEIAAEAAEAENATIVESARETAVDETAVDETVVETVVQGDGVEQVTSEETAVEDTAVEDTAVEDTVVEDTVVEDPPQAEAEAIAYAASGTGDASLTDATEPLGRTALKPAVVLSPAEMIYGPLPPERAEKPLEATAETEAPGDVVESMPVVLREVVPEGESKNCALGPRRPADAESESTNPPQLDVAGKQADQIGISPGTGDANVPEPSVGKIDQAFSEMDDWRDVVGPLPSWLLPTKI